MNGQGHEKETNRSEDLVQGEKGCGYRVERGNGVGGKLLFKASFSWKKTSSHMNGGWGTKNKNGTERGTERRRGRGHLNWL